jgi:hypothetical protein
MSDEALGLIQRAAGLLSQKPTSGRGAVEQGKPRDEFWEPDAVAEPLPSGIGRFRAL